MMRSNEKIFELLVADALMDKWDIELAELSALSEISEDEQHRFSDEFERKIRRIKNSIGRKDGIKKGLQVCTRLVVIAAAVMGVLFGGLLTQPSVYAAVQNVIRTVFSTHDSYEYADDRSGSIIFDNSIMPEYIPAGYTLRQIFYHDDSVVMMYDTIDEYELHFKYGLAYDSKISVDNEKTILQEFENRGTTFYYYKAESQDEFDTLLWYSNKYYFMIKAQLSKNELVKIAENLNI